MKTCSKCGATKEITEFRKNKNCSQGVHCWCKECSRSYASDYYYAKEKFYRMKKRGTA